MNKFTYALALGAGLALGVASPSARASALVQNLSPGSLTAAQFSSDFTSTTGVLTQNYSVANTPTTGVVQSQVFTGNQNTPFAGLTAYAYEFGVNNVSDTTGQPTYLNSAAMQFGSTPTPATFNGQTSSVFVINDGPVGSLNVPQAAPGSTIQVPATVAWQPGTTTGSLTFQYLDPTTNAGPLQAGATGGTIVVLTNDKNLTTPQVSIQNPNPQVGPYPVAFAPTGGTISSVPQGSETGTPEPATIIGWTSVLGALALVRRVRRRGAAA